MANEKRLIDVDVAEKSIRTSASLLRANIGCGYDEGAADALSLVADMLKTMPTVDAVEVVRCKDCKHWADGVNGCTEHVKCCKIGFYMVGENGYCVYGERKEDGQA